MADVKGLKLLSDLPEQDLTLNTDRRALSQILLNLTFNAIKFTEKGEVRISLRRQTFNGRLQTELSVLDTGIGIKPEDQTRLFQAFTQVDAGSSRRYEGTGLGLHLSQKLAELLKGRIVMQSEYGRGSEFTLLLEEKKDEG